MRGNTTPPLAPEAKVAIEDQLRSIRAALDPAFAPSTANAGKAGATPSAGHCAAVAAIVRDKLGGKFVSTTVQGESHWCNRISVEGIELDVDLTGDQFGFPEVQVAPAGELYPDCRIREYAELTMETRNRARLLASRAAIHIVG